MHTSVGIVIPCKDEIGSIERCLRALRGQQPPPDRIVVVDNGSTDGSLEVARQLADEVVDMGTGTISALRNAGVRALPDVDVLGFVDADVEVAPGWLATGLRALAGAQVVGSRSLAPDDASWVAARWAAVEARTAHDASHVWTQALLVDRATFQRLQGFDEDLPTAEDSDFSARAVAAGAVVRVEPRMVAVHHGFPPDLRHFVRRERWHTRRPGWFRRMSLRSRLLALAPLPWALAGSGAALANRRGGGAPVLLAWSALTVAAVPTLGSLVGSRGVDRWRDGVLLGVWAAVRASRLPAEVTARPSAARDSSR